MKKYADVIVPLPVPGEFTYLLPPELVESVRPGCRVVVPFGKKKYYSAIVTRVHETPPEACETKEVWELLDKEPVLLKHQYDLWTWIADYYLCTAGEVYKAAVPSGMKLESETLVTYNPEFEAEVPLPAKEQRVLDLLALTPEQSVDRLEKSCGGGNLLPVVKSLLEKGAVLVKEELKRSYRPRTEACVRLAGNLWGEDDIHRRLDALARAPKQQAVLMKYLELSGYADSGSPSAEVTRKALLDASAVTPAVLKGLVEKNVFQIYTREVARLGEQAGEVQPLHELSLPQARAFGEIRNLFYRKDVCLLQGVTASGKTEIYIHLIEQALEAGRQVLYLLPEIALTAQITERLRRVFGNRLGVYHSKFPDAERVEIWQKQLSGSGYDVILGVRSSVFLPFRRLGLVIVDEEHESTYKQQDPAPRYHARDTAIMLASLFKAKVLLGTATPSMETYRNAQEGKYGWVQLLERHRNVCLPRVEVVDIKELARKKRMTAQFSPLLLQKMKEALERQEQIILFQNRRGFAPMIECRSCGWIPRCRNCDVSLTYHKGLNQLTCHYCGYTCPVPHTCPACEGTELVNRGFGTEKVEDDIRQLFPDARVARMDLDTTRTRSAYEKIIDDFEHGRTDILVGTQMVSKGLDFDKVSVVGILNADSMLNYPDFRSYERAFQLMAQVAGRAGRKDRPGLVVLQTKSPQLSLIRQVVTNDYAGMYAEQVEERQLFKYPPFYRLVYVYLKHRKEDVLEQAAMQAATYLRQALGSRVLGPDRPPVARIQTLYIRKIMLKVERQASMAKVRAYLKQVQCALANDARFRSLMIYYDVDPM